MRGSFSVGIALFACLVSQGSVAQMQTTRYDPSRLPDCPLSITVSQFVQGQPVDWFGTSQLSNQPLRRMGISLGSTGEELPADIFREKPFFKIQKYVVAGLPNVVQTCFYDGTIATFNRRLPFGVQACEITETTTQSGVIMVAGYCR